MGHDPHVRACPLGLGSACSTGPPECICQTPCVRRACSLERGFRASFRSFLEPDATPERSRGLVLADGGSLLPGHPLCAGCGGREGPNAAAVLVEGNFEFVLLTRACATGRGEGEQGGEGSRPPGRRCLPTWNLGKLWQAGQEAHRPLRRSGGRVCSQTHQGPQGHGYLAKRQAPENPAWSGAP